jgi:hypothetical protein
MNTLELTRAPAVGSVRLVLAIGAETKIFPAVVERVSVPMIDLEAGTFRDVQNEVVEEYHFAVYVPTDVQRALSRLMDAPRNQANLVVDILIHHGFETATYQDCKTSFLGIRKMQKCRDFAAGLCGVTVDYIHRG